VIAATTTFALAAAASAFYFRRQKARVQVVAKSAQQREEDAKADALMARMELENFHLEAERNEAMHKVLTVVARAASLCQHPPRRRSSRESRLCARRTRAPKFWRSGASTSSRSHLGCAHFAPVLVYLTPLSRRRSARAAVRSACRAVSTLDTPPFPHPSRCSVPGHAQEPCAQARAAPLSVLTRTAADGDVVCKRLIRSKITQDRVDAMTREVRQRLCRSCLISLLSDPDRNDEARTHARARAPLTPPQQTSTREYRKLLGLLRELVLRVATLRCLPLPAVRSYRLRACATTLYSLAHCPRFPSRAADHPRVYGERKLGHLALGQEEIGRPLVDLAAPRHGS
jgi:hypothetical protein